MNYNPPPPEVAPRPRSSKPLLSESFDRGDYFSHGDLIHQMVERQAAIRPKSIAVICDSERLTYRELNCRANQLARLLCEKGVGPESIVGLYAERSVQTVVAILAILKAGGSYLPIDLAYPQDRIEFMLEDAKTKLLVTESRLRTKLTTYHGQAILLDSDWTAGADLSDENLSVSQRASNAAYVIYTSGSTGKPKGVVVTHHNVMRLFSATDAWYQFDENDVWALFHSFAFDFSVWELWGALFYGGRVIVVPYLVARAPEAFYELISKERVTVLNQTPSAFRQLVWAEESAAEKKGLSLRYVIFGGEALELQSLRPWFTRHGDEMPELINMYGITETTVHVTYRPIKLRDVEEGLGSVIGEPIPDLTLHLLDEDLKEVAVGTPGEICVGGAGVARGYLGRPELTAQKFIADPFAVDPDARLYRSGDLAQYLPNGELEYLGRIDHQVKIRGFRIELGEIETGINSHPAVRESAVICDGSSTEKRLIAYIVYKNEELSVEQLRQYLGTRMPNYMVPARFVTMQVLPLTVNGKVDRKALPVPENTRSGLKTKFAAPTSAEEQKLASIWQEVLEIAEVGVHDNFFELGGDSIRSIQVLAKAQKQGLHFSLQKLFQQPTIAELVKNLDAAPEDELPPSSIPFELISEADRLKIPAGIEDAYPAAKLQSGMVFHSDYDPLSAIFHDVFSFRLSVPFDERVLKNAIGRLAQRHSIFRTSLDLQSFSEPLQLVHKSVTIPFSIEDLRALRASEQKAKLIDWVEIEKRHRFDWSVAPLMRLHVQRYTDATFQFIVSFHHVIMDGWSLAAMLTELFQDYMGEVNGTDLKLSAPRVTYRDFVRFEQKAIHSSEVRQYWARKMENPAVHALPRWPARLRKGGREQVRGPEIFIPKEVFASLKDLANAIGLPIRTVLLAAHCRVLNGLTGQTDIITGLVANGRPQCLDGEKLIGLFLNTIPLRVNLSGGTWHDLIKATFENEQELIPHRRCPLSEIQQIAGGKSLFETTFDFVQFHVYRDLPGYKEQSFLEDHYFEANNFNFFTTFMVDAAAAELQMHFDYNPNEFCEEQIALICDYYVNVLKAMAANPNGRYEDQDILPPAEREKLLLRWNETHAEEAKLPVHQMFEAQAGRTPAATAVVFENEQLSYKDLNSLSSHLAAQLQDQNVGPGTLVGIHCERSIAMVIGQLAVLKAGGAYIPLDPAYPADRIAFMIADSGLKTILCDAALQTKIAGAGRQLILVDDIGKGATPNRAPQIRTLTPDDPAYVIYTSGSTGLPKGVEVRHGGLSNFIRSMQNKPGLRSTDKLLAVTTLSFDIAVLELLVPLTVGATVVIAKQRTAQDPVELAEAIKQHGITVMQATPATWTSLIESKWAGEPELKALCGGETLPRDLANALLKRCRELWNMYGPTETTVWSTRYKVTEGEGVVPIGKPIENTQIYILDERRNLVPTGSEGEIYIGGNGLASGYLNRTELTSEKFVVNPFQSGTRLYRTGDLGRYLPDGNILCSGRIDHQVKVRGFRIELGEIETALSQHPGVAGAVVSAKNLGDSSTALIAYWIARKNTTAGVADLRRSLEQRLPNYMVPQAFVQLAEFPLTPNGKIDRKRLPEPSEERPDLGTQSVAPRTPIEIELASAWRTVLKLDQVGIYDNFFDLGGHSLAAMRVLGILRNRFNIQSSIASFFENPTIETFALYLMEKLLKQHADKSKN
jgi:amino acid adenylation domain-containing protein